MDQQIKIKLCRKIRTPAELKAFQFTDSCRCQGKFWPDWLHAAWKSGMLMLIDTFTNEGFKWSLQVDGSSQHEIKSGDWIIMDLNGVLDTCPANAFNKVYENVPKEFRVEITGGGEYY